MKHRFIRFPLYLLITLTAQLTCLSCKKPTEGINLTLNSDVLANITEISFSDLAQSSTIPANLKVSFSGPDADNIYNIVGKKDFTVHDGKLQIGIKASRIATAGNPINFLVEASADGYLPVRERIVISAGQPAPMTRIKMLNLSAPPAGITVSKSVFALNQGVLPAEAANTANARTGNIAGKVDANGTYYDDGITSVVLPKGTTFHYYKFVQTGTKSDTVTEKKDRFSIDSTNTNGNTTTTYVRQETYYVTEIRTYPVGEYQQFSYTGNEVNVIVLYQAGINRETIVFDYQRWYNSAPASIQTITGSKVPEDELLYTTAVKKRMVGQPHFYGKDDTGNSIDISPDVTAQWFTSFVLDKTLVNPLTNRPIQAGDSIETAIDADKGITIRSVIKEVDGQLRVATQTTEAGYYFKAPYNLPFDYRFSTVLSSSDIPDPENLYASINLEFGPANFYTPVYANYGELRLLGKVVSKYPLQNKAKCDLRYWDLQLRNDYVTSGSILLSSPYLVQLPAPHIFNMSYVCRNNSPEKRVKINYMANVYVANRNVNAFANIRNGLWVTRGITPGTYNFVTWIDNDLHTETRTYSDTQHEHNEEFDLTSTDACKNL